MYATESQARKLTCWKSIGNDKEKKCAGSFCMAWGWIDDIYYISQCPHCQRVITGVDVKGMIGDEPIGTCKATKK